MKITNLSKHPVSLAAHQNRLQIESEKSVDISANEYKQFEKSAKVLIDAKLISISLEDLKKPEVKAESKPPEVKPELKPEVKPEAEVKPESKIASEPKK